MTVILYTTKGCQTYDNVETVDVKDREYEPKTISINYNGDIPLDNVSKIEIIP